ncbi:MAG: PQQ-dependent sugar dehydrogenase [Verrucomicrobiae bacterium]|nr:PQQ-dependent sugar dehydrogenase [Verrucomicrobiae bacterium]MCP5539818.1 PQQ-dependent sugar dehydrogenase [Akkermansiaceae bacterium]
MRTVLKILLKGVWLFTLWSFIGFCLYSVAATLSERSQTFFNDAANLRKPNVNLAESLPAMGQRSVEAVAVLYTNTERPADIEFDADGSGYLLDEAGFIYRVQPGGDRDNLPFAILSNERTQPDIGFRALALHPGFLDPESRGFGRFYTIEPEKPATGPADFAPQYGGETEHHQDVLCEYHTLDPRSRTFTGARKVMMRLSQPGPDHNAGDLAFDRLGRLFISVGDGANASPGADAPSRNAMSLTNVYGKVLRVDPLGNDSVNGKYGVPRRNPFMVIDGALPEIWCYGLRDPHRIDFDPFRDTLSIADVGLDGIEEINISERGGEHFGWDLCEGSFFYPPSRGEKPEDGVEPPRAEFAKSTEDGVAGGFVYRGERFPELRGKLLFASSKGSLMATRADGGAPVDRLLIGNQMAFSGHGIAGIRPGPMGEIFIFSADGGVYELQKRTTASQVKKSRRPLLCWAAPF